MQYCCFGIFLFFILFLNFPGTKGLEWCSCSCRCKKISKCLNKGGREGGTVCHTDGDDVTGHHRTASTEDADTLWCHVGRALRLQWEECCHVGYNKRDKKSAALGLPCPAQQKACSPQLISPFYERSYFFLFLIFHLSPLHSLGK